MAEYDVSIGFKCHVEIELDELAAALGVEKGLFFDRKVCFLKNKCDYEVRDIYSSLPRTRPIADHIEHLLSILPTPIPQQALDLCDTVILGIGIFRNLSIASIYIPDVLLAKMLERIPSIGVDVAFYCGPCSDEES